MKALSVKQPYASQIISGKKKYEFRTWGVSHRGPLLICASASGDKSDGLPRGQAIGIVDVVDMETLKDGTIAWHLKNPRPITPFPVKGQAALYNVEVPNQK